MRATGIVRRVDDLGRIIIPKEVRRSIGIIEGSVLEIYIDTETNGLILIPYHSTASTKLSAIAENLSTMGHTEEEWKIVEEIRKLVKKLEKIEETY